MSDAAAIFAAHAEAVRRTLRHLGRDDISEMVADLEIAFIRHVRAAREAGYREGYAARAREESLALEERP